MPRRVSARNAPSREESTPSQPAAPQASFSEQLTQLRTHWKWAAFSQFFFTFNHLFAMNDVSLNAIEDDLVHGTNVVLPRIMQRLLYTVSYDRKVNLVNWQTALRKQYRKRDPAANPIGLEPRVEEPDEPSSPPAEEKPEVPKEEGDVKPVVEEGENKPGPSVDPDDDADSKIPESTRASTLERGLSLGASVKGLSAQPSEPDSIQEQEESKNWLDLPMLVKLDSMHLLTEWQFQNPTRLRTLMRNDDENASWRIEPIGYDSKSNAYWLIGADRLWLQRPLPRPPRAKASVASLKRKRAGPSTKAEPKGKGRAAPAAAPAAKRPRLQEEPTGRGRAAKTQAKAKLDAQAKELAELTRQAERDGAGLRTSARGNAASPAKKAAPAPPPPRGTRLSARLRGREDEDEWQSVPDEWLNGEEKKVNGKRNGTATAHVEKTGLESDGSEISDLTELTDSGEGEEAVGNDDPDEGEQESEAVEEQPKEEETQPQQAEAPAAFVDDRGLDPLPVLPAGFIEWETICVTLYEWEHIAECFEKATHYTEKALYKVLTKDIVPVITEELKEIDRKQKLDMAMNQRKRSSRLLIRQSEKEEAEAAERKRREEEERNGRARRQEARAKKEEADRERREMARELRRREREEREEREKALTDVAEAATSSEIQVDVVGNGDISDHKNHTKHPRKDAASHSGKVHTSKARGNGSKTPVGEDWELDCEICNRRGINLDDGTPMMSCGLCSKWQHIACHDHADQQAGRRRRNWDVVEFFCRQCQARKAAASRPAASQGHMQAGQQLPVRNPHTTPSIASLAQASHYMNTNYPTTTVNGSTSYARESQMSNTRSAPLPRATPQHPLSQQQSYPAPISFSHYRPQQRGFSSTTESMYGPSSHTQPYGYSATHGQYSQYPVMNGGNQHYQTSQARWNPGNTTSSVGPVPYNAAATSAVHGGVGSSHYGHSTSPTSQNSMHWQQQGHPHPPPVAGPNGAPQQSRYPTTSYQPAPS